MQTFLTRACLGLLFSGDTARTWAKLCRLWRRAHCVFRGPIGYSATETIEYAALIKFLQRHRAEAPKLLRQGLDQASGTLTAYSMLGLSIIGQTVPTDVYQGSSVAIHWQLGTRHGDASLYEFSEMCNRDALQADAPTGLNAPTR